MGLAESFLRINPALDFFSKNLELGYQTLRDVLTGLVLLSNWLCRGNRRKNIVEKNNQLSRPFDAAFDVVSPYAFASLHHMLLHFAHALLRDPDLRVTEGRG